MSKDHAYNQLKVKGEDMSYKLGDLEVGRMGYDARDDDNEYTGDVAKLPHSCDEWIIGGTKEIDDLIADLTKAKETLATQSRKANND